MYEKIKGLMIKGDARSRFAQSVRVPAGIVHIAFPVLCWVLVALRWCNVWFTGPLTAAVIVFYYMLAAAYLFFAFITRMKVIAIVGFSLVWAACLFIWIPYNWILAVLLIPAVFMILRNRGYKADVIALTVIAGISVLFIMFLVTFPLVRLAPEKYAYYSSPDSRYVALEHEYQWLFFGGTDILLCRPNGAFLTTERVLYLGDHKDFGGNIEWLDESTIVIYGEKMDVFKDPVLERYDYF